MMGGTALSARVAAASGLWRGTLARQTMWLILPFGVQQFVRLATNVVLARLLAPEMFGVMVLINTLRTGAELLSDIGVGQSVVRSPNARDRDFLDTAWTVQLARGAGLTAIALLAAGPVATLYHNAQLAPIIRAVSLVFVLGGLQSPGLFLMQRDMRVGRRAAYDLICVGVQCGLTIALAAWWGNVWALVWGLVLSTAFQTLMTFVFAPIPRLRLAWFPAFASEIFHFGKWVFLSTLVYFAAMSTDRIYFSAVLPLAVVGVYGVARTFADLAVQLTQRLGEFLVFPKVVELRERRAELAERFTRNRRLALGAIAAAMVVALAVSDEFVLLLYDPRYHAAAFILPVLLASVWFSVLANFGDATLFGLDGPKSVAVGTLAKFIVLIVGLPLFVPPYGVFGGLLVLLAAEAARWLALSVSLRREGLASIGDDLVLTALIALGAVALKLALGAIGLVPTLAQWWALGASVHG